MSNVWPPCWLPRKKANVAFFGKISPLNCSISGEPSGRRSACRLIQGGVSYSKSLVNDLDVQSRQTGSRLGFVRVRTLAPD